jgi:hypothetical protein
MPKCTEKESKYLTSRKKGVRELQKLIYDRDKINKQIREVRRDLNAWDRALIAD